MRPGRPVQLTLSIDQAAPATQVVNLVDAGANVIRALPRGVVNIPKRTIIRNNLPAVQAQNLAGPRWNGNPMLTGRNYESPQSGGRTRSISIRNTHATDSLQVSFDRGMNFFTLGAGESYSGEISIQFFTVVRSTATAAGDMLVEVVAILG